MKTRIVITSVILIFAIFIFIGNYAIGEDIYMPTENEELYGTWINPEYGELASYKPQKLIQTPDGTWKRFKSRHDVATPYTGTFTLTDKWTDSEGSIWYKQVWTYKTTYKTLETIYEIVRISNSGKTLELIFSEYDFPKGITADHPNYRIYYRQE